MRERMASTGKAYRDVAARINRCADGMVMYLEGSKEAAAKVETWGARLSEAMENYVRKAEEAKQDFHQKSRSARVAYKILDEAERQGEQFARTDRFGVVTRFDPQRKSVASLAPRC